MPLSKSISSSDASSIKPASRLPLLTTSTAAALSAEPPAIMLRWENVPRPIQCIVGIALEYPNLIDIGAKPFVGHLGKGGLMTLPMRMRADMQRD